MTSVSLMQDICHVLNEKKAKDIVSINIADSSVMCDYFVVCSAKSTTQVKAICDHVADFIEEKHGLLSRSKEGYSEGRWIVLDYIDVVAHIFYDETRLFYHIERLWSTGENITAYQPQDDKTQDAKGLKPKAKINRE